MPESNFSFFGDDFAVLSELGQMAERNLHHDPNTSIYKLRTLAETVTKYILAYENIKEAYSTSQVDRLNTLRREDLVDRELYSMFDTIRRKGNKAVHEAGYGTVEDAKILLRMAFRVASWFMEVYVQYDFEAPEYEEPQFIYANIEETERLAQQNEEKVKRLTAELEQLREKQANLSQNDKTKRHNKAKRTAQHIELTEHETRMIIDEQLQASGWEADTKELRYSNGTRPEKNRNIAIAEYPVQGGYADYALFIGLELIGIVEAKRQSKDIPSDIDQAKKYARSIVSHEEEVLLGQWGDYKVPFLFATNGRDFLPQLKEKSGIWFLDTRKSTNHPRPLHAWYSPQGLKDLLKQDVDQATHDLKDETLSYLGLRDYQEEAIHAVENALEQDQRSILLAMATGTGKTRTAIGLIYRLIKARRFKRILFLVDRSALGEQAEAAFKDSKLENYRTFTEIFELQTLDDQNPNLETKVHIATVQGMLRRLFYNTEDKNRPTVDQYDCIIVDEAHRGYTLDKEMTEMELLYRDHQDYVSKYRKVLDYFDAVKIGLTATPALHTTEIFGKAVYNYTYRDAVIEGWLIDHEPPYQFDTALKKNGILFRVGEEVGVYNTRSGQIDMQYMEDEVKIEIEQFNRQVITENFNRVILNELVNYISPDDEGKTLIFAATDDHADMVVRLFKQALEEAYGPIDDNLVRKITGSIKDPIGTIKHYKNERLPKIAVTVDLLTTGIDVPSITNLVFLRRVRSRILYEQMLGRATRRCDDINKDHFNIFDAVDLYESLKPYTSMKPVVASPTITLGELIDDYEKIEKPEHQKERKEEIIAKVQRKKQRWKSEEKEAFKELSGGQSLDDFIHEIESTQESNLQPYFKEKQHLVKFIDENRARGENLLISDHEDEVTDVTRGYGNADKPEDYLSGFNRFIQDNMNKIPALKIVCTRPKDLTREQLKQLARTLDQEGYSEAGLRTAWREAKNEDIAADIISFIRQQALGDPLVSHEERIHQAMKKIYNMKVWKKPQKTWLNRIEKQLLEESVLHPDPQEAFNVEPFKGKGGYRRLNKIFEGELDTIVDELNEALYEPWKEQA